MTNENYKRYENYTRHITNLYAMLYKIKKHRVPILLGLLLLCTAVSALLFSVGCFTSAVTLEDYSYGETPAPYAKAFLSEIHYEYASIGSDAWSAEAPLSAGDYAVRAVSRGSFGSPRYSAPQSFHVSPKALYVSAHTGEIPYGESTEYTTASVDVRGLVTGDVVSDIEFEYHNTSSTQVNVKIKAVKLSSAQGKDVTDGYEIHTEDGAYTLVPRPVKIRTQTITKDYDGTALIGEIEPLKDGTLAEGDRIKLLSQTEITDLGQVENILSLTIVNSQGHDVSELYNLSYEFGTLTVAPRSLTIQTKSAEKTYDALPLRADTYTLTKGSLLEGHRLVMEFPSILRVETISNLPTYKILNAAGEDVSSKYDVTISAGKLTITPIALTFTTRDLSKVYDALPLKDQNGWTLVSGQVLPQHTLRVTHTGSQTNAGSSYNTIQVQIQDKDGNDVSIDGYKIKINTGKLTVEKRPATITTESASKRYDGVPLTNKNYSSNGFLSGHEPRVTVTGKQVAAGSSKNTFTLNSVMDSYGVNQKSNYNITSEYGTLTVLPNEDAPSGGGGGGGVGGGGGNANAGTTPTPPSSGSGSSGSGSSSSNGQGTSPAIQETTTIGFPPKPTAGEGAIATISFLTDRTPTSVYLRQSCFGDYTGTGWGKANTLTGSQAKNALYYTGLALQKNKNTSSLLKVEGNVSGLAFLPYYTASMNNNSMSANDVRIDYKDNTQTFAIYVDAPYSQLKEMTTAVLTGEAAYRKHVYDNYLAIPESTKQALLALAEENGIHKDSPTLVTDIQNYIRSAAEYDMDAAQLYPAGIDDVAVFFLTEAKKGICQHFATAATLMYRAFGIPARYTTGFAAVAAYGVSTDITMADAHAWTEIYVDAVGWVYMEVTGGDGGDGGGHDGEVSLPNGKHDIVVTAYSQSKEYDGQPFGEWPYDKAWVSDGKLADGHRLVVSVTEQGKNNTQVGTFENEITKVKVVDKNGKDVTASYKILAFSGKSTILPRKIIIQTASATKVFDGTPLTCTEFWLLSGSVLPEHTLKVTTKTTLLAPGATKNHLNFTITDRNGSTEVYKNYNVAIKVGTLTVMKN